MIRAVVDTGIIVRALIKPQGTVGPVLRWLRDGRYKLLYSDPLLDELVDVLNRPGIRDKYGLSADDIQTTVASILVRGELVVPSRRITSCRDPDDNRVLEAAAEGPVDVIVSGDEDLLVLGKFEGIPIVGPSAFLRLVEGNASDDPAHSEPSR